MTAAASFTPDEETTLILQAQAGNVAARQRIVARHLGRVWNLSRAFLYSGLPIEDLAAYGNLGLFRAIDHFDPARGVRFITYAAWWIRAAIFTAVGKPKHARGIHLVSTESPIRADEELTIGDLLRSPDDGSEAQSIRSEIQAAVARAISQLDSRLRHIITRRYFDADEPSLADVSFEMRLSRERVRQLEAAAFRILRDELQATAGASLQM